MMVVDGRDGADGSGALAHEEARAHVQEQSTAVGGRKGMNMLPFGQSLSRAVQCWGAEQVNVM